MTFPAVALCFSVRDASWAHGEFGPDATSILLSASATGFVSAPGAFSIASLIPPRLVLIAAQHACSAGGLKLPLAALLCAGFGILFGAPTLRLRGDYLAIVTLGFGEIVPIVLRNASGITNGAQGLPGVQTPSIFGFSFGFESRPFFYLILALVAVVVFVSYRLQFSRTGRAWLALREDELAAGPMGIDHVKYKLLAFAIGAGIGGLAGTFHVAKLTTATIAP